MKILIKENKQMIISNSGQTQNENLVTEMEIQFPEKYKDYIKTICFIFPDGTNGYEVIGYSDVYYINKSISQYPQVDFYIMLSSGDKDFRTETKTIHFYENTNVTGEITPAELDNFHSVIKILEEEITKVKELNITISELEQAIKEAEEKRNSNEETREQNEETREQNEKERQEYINQVKDDVNNGVFNGATFTPSIDSEGILSWTNNKGLDNPQEQNIKGPQGKDALINGRNSIIIEAGKNIEIEETEEGIKINAEGGGGQTDIGLFIYENKICMEVEE